MAPKSANIEKIIGFLAERSFIQRRGLNGKEWLRLSSCYSLLLNDEITYLGSNRIYVIKTMLHNSLEESKATCQMRRNICSNLINEFSQEFTFTEYSENLEYCPAKLPDKRDNCLGYVNSEP